MSLVRFENVCKAFAGVPVLEDVDFRIEVGEKIGLIGRNGTGKTTVLRLAAGEIPPDSGVIERMRKARIAHLTQLPRFDASTTILDVVMGPFQPLVALECELADLERRMAGGDHSLMERYSRLQDQFALRGGYAFRTEAKRVLQGLGFGPGDFDLPAGALSGGQTTRLLLALVLLEEVDLLLLDEPENHLDIDAREWLEQYLKECSEALAIISHDRQMLDTVVDRIVEVERGHLTSCTGNYEAYLRQKALVRDQQQKAFQRQQEFIRKEEAWIDRFRYKNTKARQVQSRIKRLKKLERFEAPPPEPPASGFGFSDVVRTGEVVIEASGLAMAYGDLTLYEELSFQIHRGERVGVIGPNGSGKTTLLRHLAGRLDRAAGTVRLGHKVSLGFYDQRLESLTTTNDVLSEIASIRPDWRPEQVRTFMGRLLFTGDDVFKPVRALSGGELSRVAIAKLILTNANVLLLDEPTNHLDIASREAIEAALAEFPGALLLVSHDRALVDRLADRLIVLDNGRAELHLGNYSDYRWKQDQLARQQPGEPQAAKAAPRTRKQRPDRKQENERRRRRQRVEQVERDIEACEARLETMQGQLVEAATGDYQRARVLKGEYDRLKQALNGLYQEWEALTE